MNTPADGKIAIIGLGYVGLPLAIEFGKKRDVIGFDIKPERIRDLNNHHDSTLEVSKGEFEQAKHLSFAVSGLTFNTDFFVLWAGIVSALIPII